MAQIFVSHSKKDGDLVSFFSKAFAPTKVKAVFEELEQITSGVRTPSKVLHDIENSNALFVILSHNVQKIPHTRDWVVWEAGVGKNRDIWVFEPYRDLGKIRVVVPYLRHYVLFGLNEYWLGYIRKIIESYDDSHVLPTIIAGAGIGMAVDKDKTEGAVWGGVGGTIVASLLNNQRPKGIQLKCPKCYSTYNIHVPDNLYEFRCPVCNTVFKVT